MLSCAPCGDLLTSAFGVRSGASARGPRIQLHCKNLLRRVAGSLLCVILLPFNFSIHFSACLPPRRVGETLRLERQLIFPIKFTNKSGLSSMLRSIQLWQKTHSRKKFRTLSLTFLFHILPNIDNISRPHFAYLYTNDDEAAPLNSPNPPLTATQRTTNPAGG